jgi:hypothetical protein
MTKVEARMTKEGRMTKIEGKGGSDFGLCDSFRLSAYRANQRRAIKEPRIARMNANYLFAPFASFAVQ